LLLLFLLLLLPEASILLCLRQAHFFHCVEPPSKGLL